jgi:hypothetical protein
MVPLLASQHHFELDPLHTCAYLLKNSHNIEVPLWSREMGALGGQPIG